MGRRVAPRLEGVTSEPFFGPRPVVLRHGSRIPRFDDDVWDLSPIQPQAQLRAALISFKRLPKQFEMNAREFTKLRLLDDSWDGNYPAPATLAAQHIELRRFLRWLGHRKVRSLDETTEGHLRTYKASLIEEGEDVPYVVGRVIAMLYRHREKMTRGLQVDPTVIFKRRKRPVPKAENATPRIPENTLVPLVTWAHRWVTQFAPDVLAAKLEFEQTRAQSFKVRPALSRDEGYRAFSELLAEYHASGRALPGQLKDGRAVVNLAHLARQSNCVMDVVQRIAAREVHEAVDALGLDIEMPLRHAPEGTLDSTPWLNKIPFWDVEALVDHLVASCYILIAFFSGMRDDEVKHLERGCLRTQEFEDGRPTRHWVHSVAFKNEPEPVKARWRVGQHAAAAIAVLEQLQPAEEKLLFARFHLQQNARPDPSGANSAPTANKTNSQLNGFAAWINTYTAEHSRGDGIQLENGLMWHLTTRQFRRTLAWFIARRPGGSIAGAMQFRHLSIQMFEGYAGTSASGFRTEVEGELALMRGEQLLEMIDNYEHDGLDGPAADTAHRRLEKFGTAAAKFRGVVAESATQLKRLMEASDPAIYKSELVTCVFDPDRALCLRRSSTADRPDLAQCDPFHCANVAFTKGNVANWEKVVENIDELLRGEPALPPYVASRLKETRARASRRFLHTNTAP